jgi:lipopolysaccharide transport system ATP-binding protein
MSSNAIAISVKQLSKHYQIYEQPGDRLKQFLFPKLRNVLGQSKKDYFREFSSLRGIDF